MANAKIDPLGLNDLDVIAAMYNQIYQPACDQASFERRFLGRHNPLILAAQLDEEAVGFFLGFELKPTVFFAWLYGVLPDFCRQGIATQLHEAAQAWAKDNDYISVRMECHNQHRPMLHLAIEQQYDIVGIRWDPDRADNLVILEKLLDR